MLYIRRAEDRFCTNDDWRESRHTFSFGEHRDPRFDGFRRLRAINDDRINGASPELELHDVEVFSYVVEGAVEDSLAGVVERGDVEHIYAGGGVVRRERNVGATRVVEMWLAPDARGEAAVAIGHVDGAANHLQLVARGLYEDVDIFAAVLSRGARVEHPLAAKRYVWIQVARGPVHMNGLPLATGDGAAVAEVRSVSLTGGDDEGEVLLIDLA